MRATPPPGEAPRDGETLDQLLGDVWLFQLVNGHKFSTDDLMVAWRASVAMPRARRLLDLGCGVGSVGLYMRGLLGSDEVWLEGIEAQEVSMGLARRSVARAGLSDRVRIHHGDIREPDALPAGTTFDLITGSPPYKPPGRGTISSHPQRAHCRFELRGDVYAYCEAARRWLAPGGRFSFVMLADDPRTYDAPAAAGFAVVEQFDVVFRRGRDPMLTVLTCARREDPRPSRMHDRIVIRERDGRLSRRYASFRRSLGFSIDPRDL